MKMLNRGDLMRSLTPNVLPHSPHMLPEWTKFQEIGNSNVAIRAETCRQKHPRLNMTRSCANLCKRPPLRTASVDQGYANRDGFPSSLSLEPNGHISASCHCHPLSIRSGLAPSSQLLRPNRYRGLAALPLLRRHWTICLTPGQWCAECPGVRMLGRSVGKAGKHAKQANETSSVWISCLILSLKEPRWTKPILLHKMPLSQALVVSCCILL